MTCFPGLGFVTSSLRLHWEVRDSRLCCLSLMNMLNVLSDSEVCLAPALFQRKTPRGFRLCKCAGKSFLQTHIRVDTCAHLDAEWTGLYPSWRVGAVPW